MLVVDADADVRNVVEDLLAGQGFEVHQAANPDEALLTLRLQACDVLLAPLPMLRARGGCLSRRARELRPAPWVVAMSAAGMRARRYEADATLAKPFMRTQLLAALRPPARRPGNLYSLGR